ncbi:MAG: hydrogenase maturation protease [Syntrophobacteraceae bacterium]
MEDGRSETGSNLGKVLRETELLLLIAYGNSLRRDDGAGFILAEKLEHLLHEAGKGVIRIDTHQLTPELSLDIVGEDVSAVIFLDTRAVSDPSDDLEIHVTEVRPADFASPSLGHHMDVSLLLAYTAHLFKTPPPAWLITIPGVDFNHGEGLSDTARNAIENALETLPALIDRSLKKARSQPQYR